MNPVLSPTESNSETGPDHRFILLGASNLTLGLPRIVKAIRDSHSGSIEIFAAHGHGRSYLKWSYVVVRGLPAIRECQMWDEIASRPPAKKTYALVTDLGCDLLYGHPKEELVQAVADCLQRLADMNAQIIYARPPLERIDQLNDWTYFAAKNVFFPGPTVPWKTMREAIHSVDESICATGQGSGISTILPKLEWYGIDPIHILRSKRSQAWTEILAGWDGCESWKVNGATATEHLDVWKRRPAERRMWFRQQSQQQPNHSWDDRVTLWVY